MPVKVWGLGGGGAGPRADGEESVIGTGGGGRMTGGEVCGAWLCGRYPVACTNH